MTEKLLQFIWQFQHFNTRHLVSTQGEAIQVISGGIINTEQGPDFLNARIQCGDTTWAGNIELHLKSSDWFAHGHGSDAHYQNIILHVVWQHDTTAELPFPTVELQPHVSSLLLNRYEELMQSAQFIPCQQHIRNISSITLTAWKERLLVERLQKRSVAIENLLQNNKLHWEECFWWLLARNFGMRTNSDSFEQIARSIPLNLLAKHKNQIHQLEALLLGQAGLLHKSFEEAYPTLLRKEYLFLQKKYRLQNAHAPLYFLRMRPANFPTIRLAQLAMLVHKSHHLFSLLREVESIKAVQQMLAVTANDYWHYHYRLDEPTGFSKKTLGASMIQNICINTVVPVLYAYGYMNSNEVLKDKALAWMEALPAEKNTITRGFQLLGLPSKTAAASQALIQLKNEYCNYKQCLQCAIGNQVLKYERI